MKKLLTIIFLLFALSTFADEAYENWLKTQNQTFQNYKEKQDAEFKGFLEKNWEQFQAFKGLVPGVGPKPKEIPVAEPKKDTIPDTTPIVKDIPIDIPQPEPKPKPTPPLQIEKHKQEFDFYGKECFFNFDKNLDMARATDNKSIADFFEKLSKSDYEKALNQLSALKSQMRLNDYAYVMLLKKAGSKMFEDSRKTILFVWFMLAKSGYKVKVAYSGGEICLLLPTDKTIFNTPFITIDGNRYFVNSMDTENDFSSLLTYRGTYPDANKGVSMLINSEIDILNNEVDRGYKFSYGGKAYFIPTSYNKALVELYNEYPQTDINVYFNTPLSTDSKTKLLFALKEIIKGKSEVEAVNILLSFVQHAFEYKTDGDQFGREKSFFPEELFYYKYSDCEDRSILFSYLVEKLLGLDVVGIEYPGHLATGVSFSTNLAGDSFVYNGKKFLVCDPTYINANYGMVMPQYIDVQPKVVAVK